MQEITIKDRVAFALALHNRADDYFRGWASLGAVYDWLHGEVGPWLTRIVGNGRIEDDALDAVLIRTIHAVAGHHYGQRVATRDAVLTALGEGNNAGRHVAEGRIGLAEIPLLYPKQHGATMSIIGGALAQALGKHSLSKAERGDYEVSAGGVPWARIDAAGYVLSSSYKAPLLIEALLDKTFTDEAAEAVRASGAPLTVEERLRRLERRAGF